MALRYCTAASFSLDKLFVSHFQCGPSLVGVGTIGSCRLRCVMYESFVSWESLMTFATLFANGLSVSSLPGIGLFLVICAVALRCVSSKHGDEKSGSWIPMVALIAGPVITVGGLAAFWAFNIYTGKGDFDVMTSDYLADAPAFLLIGTFAGVVSSLVFVVVYRIRLPKGDGDGVLANRH